MVQPADPSGRRGAGELPEPLRRWHQLASRWDRPLLRQNQIPAERQVDGDLLLVGIETQAVWLWAVDESKAVFERENTDGAEWTPTGEDCDEFLWHLVLVEAVFSGEIGAGANNVAANGFPRLAATWAPIARGRRQHECPPELPCYVGGWITGETASTSSPSLHAVPAALANATTLLAMTPRWGQHLFSRRGTAGPSMARPGGSGRSFG